MGGNYTQTASGTLVEQIASAGSYDKLSVTGTASLNGTLQPVLLNGYIPAVNQLFQGVITTAGGVTGAFSTLTSRFITPILSWQPIYTATTFDLLAKANFSNPALNLTPNQLAVGNALNGLASGTTGDLATVLNTIADLPSNAAVANAYQQISADKAASLANLGFAGANLFQHGLVNRITSLRYGGLGAGGGLGGLGAPSASTAPASTG